MAHMAPSRAWIRAFERSAREGVAAPIAPALIVISDDSAKCSACGQQMRPDEVQMHGYRCSVDPWPIAHVRAAI